MLAAIVVLASTSHARAAGVEFAMRGHDLQIQVDARWAGCGQGGYYPIRIRVVNTGESRNLTFQFDPSSEELPTVKRTVGAHQNAVVPFTLLIPMVGEGSHGRLRVLHKGERLPGLEQDVPLPDKSFESWSRPSLLVISPTLVELGPFEQAAGGMSNATAPGASMTPRISSLAFPGGGTPDSQIVGPASLPDNWLAYSGLDLVAVDLRTLRGMGAADRAALLAWVETGGNLIVHRVGSPPRESRELADVLGLGAHSAVSTEWIEADVSLRGREGGVNQPGGNPLGEFSMEDAMNEALDAIRRGGVGQNPDELARQILRNRGIDPDNPRPAQVAGEPWEESGEAFHSRELMLGKVWAFEESPFPGTPKDWAWLLSSLNREPYLWSARLGISSRSRSDEFLQFLIPGVHGLPVKSFIVLITLFTLLIGPLNYLFFWRRKQLFLLVLTIPAAAFLTSAVLFGYSALAHGFSVKSRVRSVTWLDQDAKTSVTTSRIALFAGLAPSDGLEFPTDTAVFPIWPASGGFDSGSVDWTEGQRMPVGWLRSRTRTQFLTVSHQPARGRIEVDESADDSVAVANGFEWDVEMLLLADADGTLYATGEIPAGASIDLHATESGDLRRFSELLGRSPLDVEMSETTRDVSSMFNRRRRYYRRGRRFEELSATFGLSVVERRLSSLQNIQSNPEALEANRYVAILKENPGVSLGVEDASIRDGYHVVIGSF